MLVNGRVIKSVGSNYLVSLFNKEDTTKREVITATIKGKLRLKDIKTTTPISVGDTVFLEHNATTQDWHILERAERKNYLIRRSTNLSKQAHILASNIDAIVLIASAINPETPLVFIDRVLLCAESQHIETIILFNKTDLLDAEQLENLTQTIELYNSIGYDTVSLSLKDEASSLKTLFDKLSNKTIVLTGNSGVGKSTLTNILLAKQTQVTKDISAYHSTGVHTTSFSEMFEWHKDSYIIDTPGIKGFGVIDIEKEEIKNYFKDIFAIAPQCQFHNCTHIHEPKCAVHLAVENGVISPSRYDSYVSLFLEDNVKHR